MESWAVRELESSARPPEVFGGFCFGFKYLSIYLVVPGLFSWGTLDLGYLSAAH